jgi:hypothetical protein
MALDQDDTWDEHEIENDNPDPYMELLEGFLDCFTLAKKLVNKLDEEGIKLTELEDLREEMKRIEELPKL